MTIDTLKRVMWRLRKNTPNGSDPSYLELRRAIMHECGTDERTFKYNKKALERLGWIDCHRGEKLELTDKDITDE